MDMKTAIEYEQWQKSRLRELADQMAAECPWMWSGGDGDGGHVINAVMEAFGRAGLRPKPPAPTPRKNRPVGTKKALAVFRRDGYKCVRCGTDDDLTVDHIHPQSLGGGNDMDNLQALCQRCNSSKGTKTMSEWMGDS